MVDFDFARLLFLPSVPVEAANKLPKRSGIYYAIAQSRVLYVGQAVNLRSRWSGSSHGQKARLLSLGGVRLYYRLCPRYMLDLVEAEEIAKLDPAFNVQRPDPRKHFKGLAKLHSTLIELGWMLAIAIGLMGLLFLMGVI